LSLDVGAKTSTPEQHAGAAVRVRRIMEGEAPGKAYTDQAQQLSKKRLATAGYRLAAVLNAIFVK
jgi:hypothetical protein